MVRIHNNMANDINRILPVITTTKGQNAPTNQFYVTLYSQEDIQSRIFTVRGQHIMLDSDITHLYITECSADDLIARL